LPAHPPAAPQKRLSLRLGALLIVLWMAATALIVVLRLPLWSMKLALGVCAGVWALHVARVAFVPRFFSSRRRSAAGEAIPNVGDIASSSAHPGDCRDPDDIVRRPP
jgi:hypothetical protein